MSTVPGDACEDVVDRHLQAALRGLRCHTARMRRHYDVLLVAERMIFGKRLPAEHIEARAENWHLPTMPVGPGAGPGDGAGRPAQSAVVPG